MNAQEFNQALGLLINKAMNEGVLQGKMDASQLLGAMRIHEGDLLKFLQERAAQTGIIPVSRIIPRNPPNGH